VGPYWFKGQVYQIFGHIIKREGKLTDFGLKYGKGFGKRAAHPHQISFLGVPSLGWGEADISSISLLSKQPSWKPFYVLKGSSKIFEKVFNDPIEDPNKVFQNSCQDPQLKVLNILAGICKDLQLLVRVLEEFWLPTVGGTLQISLQCNRYFN